MDPILKHDLVVFLRLLSYLVTAILGYLTGGAG